MALRSARLELTGSGLAWDQSGTNSSLLALLLLELPLLLTFTALVVLPELADASHQLVRPHVQLLSYVFFIFLPFRI
jgi:hypothetical protein